MRYNIIMNEEVEKYVDFLLKEGCETPNAQKRLMYIRAARLLLELNIKNNSNNINITPDIKLDKWTWQPNTNHEPVPQPYTWPQTITCGDRTTNLEVTITNSTNEHI